MGLRSLVAQYFGGPMGAEMVASHDEKYADTGAENPYLEQIINQSNHSGVTKYGSAIAGAAGGNGGNGEGGSGEGMDTSSEVNSAVAKKGGGSMMGKIGGGAKGGANHKDMFNQPIGEDGSMSGGSAPQWSKQDALKDFNNDVNVFHGGGAGADVGNRIVNASLPDSWKDNIAPWTPQNIYGTAGKTLISGAKSLFGSSSSSENDFGDVDLD